MLGLMVSVLVCGSSSLIVGTSPALGHRIVFFGKTLTVPLSTQLYKGVQSNIDYPDIDHPESPIIRTFSLVTFYSWTSTSYHVNNLSGNDQVCYMVTLQIFKKNNMLHYFRNDLQVFTGNLLIYLRTFQS